MNIDNVTFFTEDGVINITCLAQLMSYSLYEMLSFVKEFMVEQRRFCCSPNPILLENNLSFCVKVKNLIVKDL